MILDTPSAPHPKVEIVSVDAAAGVCIFNWLTAGGARVDSGGSIARFTPSEDAPDDATLSDAISNPPPDPAPVDVRPIGTRIALTGAFHHSEISASNGVTLLGILPAGWSMVDFQARLGEGFDPTRTISVGTAASPTRWVNALAVSSIGFKQATPLQLTPQSATSDTLIFIKKSAATTVGDIITATALIERKF